MLIAAVTSHSSVWLSFGGFKDCTEAEVAHSVIVDKYVGLLMMP